MDTLQHCFDAFLNYCRYERNFSAHTIKAYRLDLDQFRRFGLARSRCEELKSVDRSFLRDYVRTLHDYKSTSQRRKVAVLKSLFGFLEREEVIESNPTRSIRLDIKLGRRLPRTISLATLEALFRQLYRRRNCFPKGARKRELAIRDVALFELLFSSGMRVSEVSNLRVATVDLERGAVLVRGKGNKERFVPICDQEVLAALAFYVGSFTTPRPGDAYFFVNRFGRRLSEQSIRMALHRHARAAGIEKITPHVLRHTVATMLLEQGVDLRFIQSFLGHSSIVTTTIYAHVNDKSQREILNSRHPRRLVGTLSAVPSTVTEG
jgi:integrase/recombinase XerD